MVVAAAQRTRRCMSFESFGTQYSSTTVGGENFSPSLGAGLWEVEKKDKNTPRRSWETPRPPALNNRKQYPKRLKL